MGKIDARRWHAKNPYIPSLRTSLGNVLILSALSLPPDLSAQEKNVPDACADIRARVTALIPDLDSDTHATREKASKELKGIVTTWVQQKKTSFPALQELENPKRRVELEARRRLDIILQVHDGEMHALRMLPTMVELKEKEWNLPELIQELGKQTGEHIAFANPVDGKIRTGGKQEFWKVMELIREKAGTGHRIGRFFNDAISIRDPSKHELYAFRKPLQTWTQSKGAFLAQLTRYPALCCEEDDPVRANILSLDIDTEKRFMMSVARITDAKAIANTGKELPFSQSPDDLNHRPERSLQMEIPKDKNIRTMTCSVTAEIVAFEQKTVRIPDLNKKQVIYSSGEIQITYTGISSETGGNFSVNALANVQGNHDNVFRPFRCYAFDAKDNPIPIFIQSSQNSGGSTFLHWEFTAQPHRVSFSTPGRQIHRIETFEFIDLPVK